MGQINILIIYTKNKTKVTIFKYNKKSNKVAGI